MSTTISKKPFSLLSFFSSIRSPYFWNNLTSILSSKKTVKPVEKYVDICVVNESIFTGSSREVYSKEVVTVIYDRDSLDSLYGLAFFEFIYEGQVQAVPYQQCVNTLTPFKPSDRTIVLGVDIALNDLIHLNSLTKSIRIFAYRGTFNYLYNLTTQKLFKSVTLYQADNDYFIGGKGTGKLEDSVAMMLKILYSKSTDWADWNLKQHATTVAHATCFYENIPVYGLTKSIFDVQRVDGGKATASIHNLNDVLMHDLRVKLETCLDSKTHAMTDLQPLANVVEYNMYRKRLQTHIDRTRKLQGWVGKGVFDAEKQYAYCIPAIGFAVHDLIALSSNNVDTTVCIEDLGDKMVYYIYSKIEGKANSVARVLMGEKTWMKGHLVCTSKLKSVQDRR